jgi:SPOR domain
MAPRRRAAAAPAYFEDATASNRAAAAVVMIIVVAAFAGLVWNIYGGREAPRITPPTASYKVAPPADAANAPDPAEQNALYDALEGRAETASVTPAAAPEAPLAEAASDRPLAAPPAGAPAFVNGGRFVAQVAALQAEPAVANAWARLAARAPALFADAKLDVERADLGARGIYYRVRAGYFADRANAGLFCDRIKQLGQDCMVVAR